MTGRPFPERDNRTPGIGWAALAGVAQELVGAPGGALSAAVQRFVRPGPGGWRPVRSVRAPAGRGVADLAGGWRGVRADVGGARSRGGKADSVARVAGPLRRVRARGAWPRSSPGDLRIGLRAGHLEARASPRPSMFRWPTCSGRACSPVTWATPPSWPETARCRRAELALFRPLKSMLASPVADEAEALRRMAPPVWVEDKYDGIRAQLHKQGDDVRLYSRDLNDVTSGYPEVVEAARRQAVGRHPRRRAAGVAQRHGSAVPAAPDAAGPQIAQRVAAGHRAGDLRRVRRACPWAGRWSGRRTAASAAAAGSARPAGLSEAGRPAGLRRFTADHGLDRRRARARSSTKRACAAMKA